MRARAVWWGVAATAAGAIAFSLATAAAADQDDDRLAVTVEMRDNVFDPSELTVPTGTAVTFDNVGAVIHNALDVDGAWGTAEVVREGEAETIVFDTPGTYRYLCTLHAPPDASAGMVGTLTVSDDVDEVTASSDETTADAEARLAEVTPVPPTGVTRTVPDEFPTIQSAVDAAEPGDLVLVGPGTYREQVDVSTEQIVVRGTEREAVVVDGEFQREMGFLVTADGVAIENMTVRDVTANGFYWDGVAGFRGSYLTATNAAIYGIYAFDSVDGVFEHSHASGSADGGYYVGQCADCRTILNEVTAEWNGFGFSGTNASTSLYLVNSTWRDNGAGIVPNTLDSQRFAPSRGATIAGNLVIGNGNLDVPVVSATWPAFGHGIVLAGGVDHDVRDNVVLDHPGYGIAATPNLDRNLWAPGGSRITGNLVRGSGRADVITVAPSQRGGDCLADNDLQRTRPRFLGTARPCDGAAIPSLGSFRDTWLMIGQLAQFPGERLPQDMAGRLPEPSGLPQLPGRADAEVRPAVDVFATYDGVDLEAIVRPDHAGEQPGRAGRLVLGVPLGALAGWPGYFVAVGWLLPVLALLTLAGAALVDGWRREDRSATARAAWTGVVGGAALVMALTWWPAAVVASLVVSVVALARPSPRRTARRRWTIVGVGVATVVALTPALVVAGMLMAGIL